MQEQHHKSWSAEDFERYHSGKMTEAEMHALEKAALDDPFLEDALEGYALTETPAADITELKEKLWPSGKDDETPVVWFRRKTVTQLFKAAAVLILFGGLGWFIFNNSNTKKDGTTPVEIAANKPATGNDSVASLYQLNDTAPIIARLEDEKVPAIIKQNSPSTAAEPSPQEEKNNYNINIPAERDDLARNEYNAKDKEGIIVKPAPKSAELQSKVSGIEVRSQNDRAKADIKLRGVSAAQQNNQEVRGRVVDNTGNPVPYATIRNNADGRQQAVSADAQGNFSIRQNNAAASNNLNVEVNAAGYEPANTNLRNNSPNNTIVLNQSQNTMEEVVVTGLGVQRKKEMSASSQTVTSSDIGKKEKYQWSGKNSYIHLRNAAPLEGWPYFYYVMNDSIVKNSQFNKQKGKIILQYDIDSIGAVKNIIVKKSLSDSADNAAIRIMLKSPVLRIINKQKKGEAVIKFGL